MKPTIKNILLMAGISTFSGIAFIHCGSDSTSTPLAPTGNPGAANTDLGNFNLSCNGQQSSGQQKQVPFQQQQQSGCKQQKFQYQQQKAVDYDVNLDCDNKQVIVKNKGVDQQQQALPIQSDGSVKGKVQYQQQMQNDGKGNQVCWIQYEVSFDGKAQCGGTPSPTPLPTPTPTPSSLPSTIPSSTPSSIPSASPSDTPSGPGKLSLITTVNFLPTTSDALKQIGIDGANPTPVPSASPSAPPSPSPSPSATPSASPSPSPSATPSQTPSPSPSVTPTPSGTPVVICVVDDPCPIVGSTDLSCGQ